jgi:hypothetical protein
MPLQWHSAGDASRLAALLVGHSRRKSPERPASNCGEASATCDSVNGRDGLCHEAAKARRKPDAAAPPRLTEPRSAATRRFAPRRDGLKTVPYRDAFIHSVGDGLQAVPRTPAPLERRNSRCGASRRASKPIDACGPSSSCLRVFVAARATGRRRIPGNHGSTIFAKSIQGIGSP